MDKAAFESLVEALEFHERSDDRDEAIRSFVRQEIEAGGTCEDIADRLRAHATAIEHGVLPIQRRLVLLLQADERLTAELGQERAREILDAALASVASRRGRRGIARDTLRKEIHKAKMQRSKTEQMQQLSDLREEIGLLREDIRGLEANGLDTQSAHCDLVRLESRLLIVSSPSIERLKEQIRELEKQRDLLESENSTVSKTRDGVAQSRDAIH